MTVITTISDDWQKWFPTESNGYYVWNNVWGRGSFVNGKDYIQQISVDPNTFPNGTTFAWRWPDEGGPDWCYGYPEIYYTPPTSIQIKNLKKCVVEYELVIRGNFNVYDVLFDIWPSADAAGKDQVTEISFYPFWPSLIENKGVTQLFTRSIPNFHAQIYPGFAGDGSTPSVSILPCNPVSGIWKTLLSVLSYIHLGYYTPVNVLSGTIDLLEIFQYLVRTGAISEDWYISNLQLGVEPQCPNWVNGKSLPHAGSVRVDKLSYVCE